MCYIFKYVYIFNVLQYEVLYSKKTHIIWIKDLIFPSHFGHSFPFLSRGRPRRGSPWLMAEPAELRLSREKPERRWIENPFRWLLGTGSLIRKNSWNLQIYLMKQIGWCLMIKQLYFWWCLPSWRRCKSSECLIIRWLPGMYYNNKH